MRTPAVVCFSLLACSLLAPSLGEAQPAPPPAAASPAQPGETAPSKTVDQQVIELFDRGAVFFTKSQWAEAEKAFQAAWDLKKSYDIAGNLGEVELKIGQTREAAMHLSYSLRHYPATGKETHRQMLQQLFDHARKELVTLNVRVSVDGAQVLVGGLLAGTSPLAEPIFTEAGQVTVEAKLAGHEPATQTVELGKGWTEDIELTLKPKPEKPAGPRANGAGDGAPKSAGLLDGKSVPLILVGAGLTTGLLVTGLVLTAAANGKSADAAAQLDMLQEKALPCADPAVSMLCVSQRDALRSQSSLANGALAVFLIGGAAAAATVTYVLWPSSPKAPEPSGALRPLVAASPDGGGVWVTGAF